MDKKAKIKLSIGTIIITATVSYLLQHWFKHSGLEDKTLNKFDDIKDGHNEIASGAIGGIIALGMKVLETE